MADHWIQGAVHPSRKGQFTAKAKKAGMGVQEFASHVLANPGKYSKRTVDQAKFARQMAKMNRR